LLADRIARVTVVAGGLTVIASILGILVFILAEVAPLFRGARVERGRTIELAGAEPLAVLVDEYRSQVATLDAAGMLRVVELDGGAVRLERTIDPARIVSVTSAPGTPAFAAATADGRVLVQAVEWATSFSGGARSVSAEVPPPVVFPLDPAGQAVGPFTVTVDGAGAGLAAAVLADRTLTVVARTMEESFATGEATESWQRRVLPLPRTVDRLLVDPARQNLYAGTAEGDVVWWPLGAAGEARPQVEPGGHGAVTTLSLLIGGRSLLAGHADGTVTVWFPVRQPDESFRLTRIREFRVATAAVRHLAPSGRKKGFLAASDDGTVALGHSTSGRLSWSGRAPIETLAALAVSPRDDGAFFAGAGRLVELDVHNPHPEVGWRALFGKVWYEGYPEPAHVWQSSGGSDAFEPKLSLTPLMVGTLKGTLYSLVLAIPLGVLGAMYTSQFMHPSLRAYVKPTVEIMAALPSVVLGFLAGLWLAPRVADVLAGLLAMAVVIPLLVVVAGLAWRRLPGTIRRAVPDGSEALLQALVILGSAALCLALDPYLERVLFGGSVQDWLAEATGLAYDQRNALVVGLAMGFAVIPIIFSIAEDAFSNVPRILVSGSLALGASRWQTVTRVVLPTASPGIFSAVMIGFGRAVGETMIVLMATGNTPILDWSPFNGFRTLSANIAVEIPEAPQGDTLYRTLFLSALILFAFTFLSNTLAEVVRQRLRRRYAQL
jgi:phosphate transport system permease protein